ncbi:hypothetical protein GCM10023188_06190 [Pontibacter saemangeumensis]|uniref:DUF4304 domain-containing protein n=2 Tax=Pontibacter saemangeumensis TaxID=1084525 RepID=A0ABP8L9V8_9BACT
MLKPVSNGNILLACLADCPADNHARPLAQFLYETLAMILRIKNRVKMKTPTEVKFDKVVKVGFHEVLKPLGFKKKGNNFYLQLENLGQIINIQKSSYYSKDHINFTINTGIFLPEYWKGLFYNQDKEVPSFPTEPECLIRKRIGELRNQNDTWYDIDDNTEESQLISEMRANLENFILPYFNQLNTKEALLDFLNSEKLIVAPLAKLIVYGESKQLDRAKAEYTGTLSEIKNPHFLETVREYGQKYGLE